MQRRRSDGFARFRAVGGWVVNPRYLSAVFAPSFVNVLANTVDRVIVSFYRSRKRSFGLLVFYQSAYELIRQMILFHCATSRGQRIHMLTTSIRITYLIAKEQKFARCVHLPMFHVLSECIDDGIFEMRAGEIFGGWYFV